MKFRPPVRDLSGSELGQYRLVRKIAEGGMGEVYEGVQLKLDRPVAVKLLAEQLAREPEFLARFEREAKSAAALNHPNIVQVYDFGCADGQYYFVMELVEGQDLSLLVKAHGKLPIPVALEYFEQAVLALQFAARHAIIHRDVKPANLMLTRDGRVKVADLGLAKKLTDDSEVTLTGVGMGSPHFLAPEQADDAAHVDHRADIYSLGVTLLFRMGIVAVLVLLFVGPRWGSDRKSLPVESETPPAQVAQPNERPQRTEPPPPLPTERPLPGPGERPGFSDSMERGKGKGGPAMKGMGGGLRPPWPRRPEPDRHPLRDAPIPQMLAEADAYAAANKEEFVEIIHRYGQIEEKVSGTPWQKEVERRFDQAQQKLEAAAGAYIKQTEARMEPLLQAGKFDEAYQLWRDFPLRFQTMETDQEVLQLLRRRLPPDFVPR
ncbi:MAG: serine/threonine protein kinase [Verrucomicrobia bacterium]|nr:serine/threonine protein kinase [Verrucomicrobiota bacterium]